MNNLKVKRMVGIALLTAVVVVLQMLGSFIHIGPVSISLVLVPIVLGAAIYGPGAGAVLGGAFGIVATVNCITGVDSGGAMVFQASPVLCVLVVMAKGILAGVISGVVYRLLKAKNGYIAMLCAAIVCPVVNTGVFLICMAVFFMDVLAVWAGGTDIAGYVLTALVVMNFLPELALNVILSPAIQRIIRIINKNG